jgi:hypothetical protein
VTAAAGSGNRCCIISEQLIPCTIFSACIYTNLAFPQLGRRCADPWMAQNNRLGIRVDPFPAGA